MSEIEIVYNKKQKMLTMIIRDSDTKLISTMTTIKDIKKVEFKRTGDKKYG